MKRVFIIHGWDFNPGMNWYPSVKKHLEGEGFEVIVPEMPDSHHPSISQWAEKLVEVIGEVDKDTYIIAHSIGCKAIMKFLESEVPEGDIAGGIIFVAPWFTLSPAALPNDEYKSIAKPWLDMTLNFDNIRSKVKKFVAFFSDNDPYVPINNLKLFEDALSAEVIIESGMGHFDDDSAIKDLPQVADKLLEMAQIKERY